MIIEGALEAPLFTSEPSDADIAEFQAWVREAGQALYRDLPWRNTRDAYAIWISEAMLQQTQVSRVLSRWERFLRHFPTVDALASASSADVVEEWQGLGYNRRALALKRAADLCSAEYAGRMPAEDVRGWYYALLDVGARLKKDHKNPTRRAAAYTRQSKFEGSRRQKRAWLVREVMAAPGLSSAELLRRLNVEERKSGRDGVEGDEFESIMTDLAREGFFHREGDEWLA